MELQERTRQPDKGLGHCHEASETCNNLPHSCLSFDFSQASCDLPASKPCCRKFATVSGFDPHFFFLFLLLKVNFKIDGLEKKKTRVCTALLKPVCSSLGLPHAHSLSVCQFTPVAGLIFETKNRAIFRRFFWRDFSGEKLLPENSFLGQ